jgi:hypothetical protein
MRGGSVLRFLKILFFLAVLGAIGLVGFAYFGDLTPNLTETRIPVSVDGAD